MTKKHFIALADVLRESKPPVRESNLEYPGVRRIDMDSGGIPMCEGCAKDALESGVFD